MNIYIYIYIYVLRHHIICIFWGNLTATTASFGLKMSIFVNVPQKVTNIPSINYRTSLSYSSPTSKSCPFLLSSLPVRSYRPHLEVRDPTWGNGWSHTLHWQSPSWGFPQLQGKCQICAQALIISWQTWLLARVLNLRH